jgi:PII-like signaling protein
MNLPEEGQLLRIFIGESDRYENIPLYEWLVKQARQKGLAGATVLRGIAGFGAASRIHTANILRLSLDLPVVVEIVDKPERIQAFLPIVDGAVKEGLVTTEKAHIKLYRAAKKPEADDTHSESQG